MANYRITIAVNRLTPETGGLTVSTVHGVKGLEFGYVFVANATDHNWRLRQSRSVIRLPMTIVRTDTNSENDPIEDERRLFYVGMTRARHQLYLSWANQTNDGRTTLPCRFVSEMDGFYWEQKVTISKSQAEQFLTTSIMPVSQFKIKQRELKYIRERISQEPFSFTDWAAYKACPRRYLLVNLFRFPTKESFSLTFGSAVHRALELFFKQYKAREKLPSVKTLTDFFDQALRRLGPVSDQEIMADKGQKLLAGYYEKYNQSWPIPVGVEYSFRSHHVLLDDIWLTGKYDRIDPLDPLARTVRIVDYKTGSKSKTRGEIEGTTKNSDGSIKSQLVFYSLLAKLDRHFPYKIKESNLDFLDDAGSFRQERFEISQKEIDQLKKDIIATYQQILTDDKFPHTGENLEGGCELCGQFELS
jgi:DNA helicase-2/ATP-dependent DNA helicase PcrA